jgi:hypothetical protein
MTDRTDRTDRTRPPADTELDRLLSGLCDGTLSDADLALLGRRIASEPAARRMYLDYIDLHAALTGPAVTPPMGAIPTAIPTSHLPPVRVRRWPFAVALTAAAVAILAVGLSLRWQPNATTPPDGPTRIAATGTATPRPATVPVPSAPVARVAEVVGAAELRGADGAVTEAAAGAELPPGRTLRTGADGGYAVVALADGSRLELGPDTQVRLAAAPAAAPEGPSAVPAVERVYLSAGVLRAEVKPRGDGRMTLLLATPQAEVEASAGRYTVSAASAEATLVETESGEAARMTRTADGVAVDVPVGSWAMAMPTTDAAPPEVRTVGEPPTAPRLTTAFRRARALAFSADGSRLVAGSESEWASLDAATGRPLSAPERLPSPGKSRFVPAARAPVAFIWDRDGGATLIDPTGRSAPAARPSMGVRGGWTHALSADGSTAAGGHVVSGPPDAVRVWRLPSGEDVATLPIEGQTWTLALSADGRRLAVASDRNRRRAADLVFVFDLSDGGRRQTLRSPDRGVRALAFSPDGTRLAGVTEAGTLHVWDVAGAAVGGPPLTLGSEWVRPLSAVAFSPDGRIVAAGATDGRVRLWRVDGGGVGGPDASPEGLVLPTGRQAVTALAFAPDGRTLAVASVNGPVTLWDVP